MVKWNFNQEAAPEKRIYKRYHRASNHSPYTQMVSAPRREYEKRNPVKQDHKKVLHIPNPEQLGKLECHLSDALLRRRTNWNFSQNNLNEEMLVSLLSFSFGITDMNNSKRSYPSGGQFYPIEIFLIPLKRVVDHTILEEKVYRYNVDFNELVEVKDIDIASLYQLSGSTDIGFFSFDDAQVLIFLVANDKLIEKKYLEFTYRLLLLEAGHMAQNFLLTSTALGLSAVPMGGFHEKVVHQFLGIEDSSYMTLYTLIGG